MQVTLSGRGICPLLMHLSIFLIFSKRMKIWARVRSWLLQKQRFCRVSSGWPWWLLCQPIQAVTSRWLVNWISICHTRVTFFPQIWIYRILLTPMICHDPDLNPKSFLKVIEAHMCIVKNCVWCYIASLMMVILHAIVFHDQRLLWP